MKAATAQEEARRGAATLALRARSSTAGETENRDIETQWELSYVHPTSYQAGSLKVVDVGFSQLQSTMSDSEEGGEETSENSGRLVFGNFRKKEVEEPTEKPAESGDESEDSEVERKRRMKRKDPLKGLKSISNAGTQQLSGITCNKCGKKGHKQVDCPKTECYNCGGRGHVSSDCPNPHQGDKRKSDMDGRREKPKKFRR